MKLGAPVFWAERVDMGPDQPPQVRVRSGTMVFRQDDAAGVLVGKPTDPHPASGFFFIARGVLFVADKADADMYANGMAARLIDNFKFPTVDIFYSDGSTKRIGKA